MYKEIDLGNDNKLVFFREVDFWEDVLSTKIKDTRRIDIVTYNFNFKRQEGRSFYNKLIGLAEKGVNIRLMYHPEVSGDTYIDDIFAEEILCVRMPFNHCKIFWSDNFVYIGSANFSLGSNNNYEAGFISTNLEVINKVHQEILCNDIWQNPECKIITFPDFWEDPLNKVRGAIDKVDFMIKLLETENYKGEKEKLLFDCSDLEDLVHVIGGNKVGLSPAKLMGEYEELERYTEYGVFLEFDSYAEDDIKTIKKIFKRLKKILLEIENDVQELYMKYGRYNFICD